MAGRYNFWGYQDDRVQTELDAVFMGINQKLDPSALPAGMCRDAVNKRFNGGRAEDRAGTLTPVFANIENYGTLYGSGIFSDPNNQEESLMLVAGDRVWLIRDGSYPSYVPLDTGETVTAPADPVQAFDRVVLFRGTDKAELEWNPAVQNKFLGITQSDTGDGTDQIPNAETGTVYANRMVVPIGDSAAVSDILDYTRYVPILSTFRINQGTSDSIVRVFGFSQNSVIFFKGRSIYIVNNVTGDLSSVSLDTINEQLGCFARRSPATMGADVVFLSDSGVYLVSQVFEARLATAPVALSEPIEPTIARINWDAAQDAAGIVFGDRYYLAVPLDGSAVNNALLVYNRKNQQWEGVDTWDPAAGVQIDNLHVMNYQGKRRLYAVNYAAGKVYVLEEGGEDFIGGVLYDISSTLKTRGYSLQDPGPKAARRVILSLATWAPRYGIAVETEGVNESYPLVTDQAKDRLKYYLHGKPDYDPSNDNDDHAAPKREDYSVELDEADFQVDNSGIDFDLKQEVIERHTVRQQGRWFSLVIENSEGICDVRGVALEHLPANRSTEVAA